MSAYGVSHDKRSTPRYPTRGVQACLSWKIGDAHQSIVLRLEDISMGGFAALAAAVPPAVGPLWVSFPGASVDESVEVALVSARRKRILFVPRRNYVLRMRFIDCCTFDLFKNAIQGFARDFVADGPIPDDVTWFNRQSWR